MEKTIKTREEVDALKREWCQDPCWELTDCEGFEEYKQELAAFRDKMKKTWKDAYEQRQKSEAERMGLLWPEQAKVYNTIRELQQRLVKLEGKIYGSF